MSMQKIDPFAEKEEYLFAEKGEYVNLVCDQTN